MEPARMKEIYRECMRNHAARLGTYACDGCCEYSSDTLRPNVLFCTACGCHRNFHRKVAPNSASAAINVRVGTTVDIVRARRRKRSKFTAEQKAQMRAFAARLGWKVRKQEEAGGEDEVSSFCKDIGITRQVFKIWIHNHKGTAAAATSTTNTNAAPGDAEGEGDGGCEGAEGEEEVKGSASMEEEK
ncbi:zinc-finger homeodomain protein 11-like [Elaeis guineensis]|uniref:Zinc-finger homeodomain protein 11-like n=1 Tax=Elaeis guineensis var. tenera TaxID=51953 RepID=A0A6I9S372_ELAGV|nr:zinc-finger homeodomain protein 11-like [Elaeis guineensis]